jgi:uncharacterized membrane protein YcaP (DUF421 family)
MSDLINAILGGDTATQPLGWLQIVARCAIVYLVGLLAVRVGKSRLLSKASPLDVILAFILGSLLSRGINGSAALSGTVVAVVTLVAIHWSLTALACRYHAVGNLIKGQTYLLISNGEIQRDNLRRAHISQHDLVEQMRLNANVEDTAQVQVAYKERSGEVGVVKRPLEVKVVEVAVREGVQVVRVELSGAHSSERSNRDPGRGQSD